MGSVIMHEASQPWQDLSSSALAGVGVLLKSRGDTWGKGQWGREEGLEILFYLETGAYVSLTSRACFSEGCLQNSQV